MGTGATERVLALGRLVDRIITMRDRDAVILGLCAVAAVLFVAEMIDEDRLHPWKTTTESEALLSEPSSSTTLLSSHRVHIPGMGAAKAAAATAAAKAAKVAASSSQRVKAKAAVKVLKAKTALKAKAKAWA